MSIALDALLPSAVDIPRSCPDPVLKPLILSRGTLITADLGRARKFYESFLGLECKMVGDGRMLVRDTDPRHLRHGNGGPYWVMDVQQVDGPIKTNMFKHWGIDVASAADVDRVHDFAFANKVSLGLQTVRKPRMQHGTYSFYLQDFDSNWWEVECRPPGEATDEVFARGDGAFN
jgi:catechol 2,3-dioxygenase-like lactoylglutathione lyase family enzyme